MFYALLLLHNFPQILFASFESSVVSKWYFIKVFIFSFYFIAMATDFIYSIATYFFLPNVYMCMCKLCCLFINPVLIFFIIHLSSGKIFWATFAGGTCENPQTRPSLIGYSVCTREPSAEQVWVPSQLCVVHSAPHLLTKVYLLSVQLVYTQPPIFPLPVLISGA